jgi:flagellar motor switch protein FliN/FliY
MNKPTEPQGAAAQLIALSELHPQTPTGTTVLGGSMNLLAGVKVGLSVVVGEAQTTVGELMDLKALSILTIDRKADYPVDVMLNGNVVARGHLVVVDDNFGVRISEVAPALKP